MPTRGQSVIDPGAMDAALNDVQAAVARLADEAMGLYEKLIGDGMAPAAAVRVVQRRFGEGFVALLAQAMNAVPGQAGAWSVRQVRAMPVGDIVLSPRLHNLARQTAHEVQALVARHAQGVQQARALSLRLYDGYSPADGIVRPLEGRARAELPKALRDLTADPATRDSLARLVEAGQAQAARLKTQALRAGYAEAFDAWERGAGQAVLKRKLDVALKEKTRYMADRIAQTELARAHQNALADELAADDSIDVVQVVLSGSHPRPDICDLHARADLFGLGAGCYPKARAPVPTFHPFCRCRLRSRPDLSATSARLVEGGEAAAQREWLRSIPSAEAARVLGSQDRLRKVLRGADPVNLVNAGVPQAYRLRRVGGGENVGMSDVPLFVPRAADAIVPQEKLARYALNPSHPEGANKARVFASALGFTADNAALLEKALLQALPQAPALKRRQDAHGQRYQADVEVTGPRGTAIVRTAWIVAQEGDAPRLTSLYVKKEKP